MGPFTVLLVYTSTDRAYALMMCCCTLAAFRSPIQPRGAKRIPRWSRACTYLSGVSEGSGAEREGAERT